MKKDETMEREANIFACLLLMPEQEFKKDMEQPIDLSDETFLKSLSDKYQVPANAVAVRMSLYFKSKNYQP